MASLQAYGLNLLLRYQLKRRRVPGPLNVAAARNALGQPQKFKMPDNVAIEPFAAKGLTGDWIRWTGAAGRAAKALYYLHGGGYFACSPALYRPLTTALAAALRCDVLCIDYRLAPEHPFPAAVEDALAGWRWLLANGYDAASLALGGDSAGGGLAAAFLLAAKDEGLPLPASAVLYSPMADLAVTGGSIAENDWRCSMFWGGGIKQAADVYLNGADPGQPYASPIYGDLSGLPPMLVFASTKEVLRDDGVRLVERTKAAGGEARLEMRKDLPHVWPLFNAILPEGRKDIEVTADFIRSHFADEAANRQAHLTDAAEA